MDYRRSAERVATSLLGLMDFGDSVSTCLVTDMSDRGARLRVSPTKPLPVSFQLRLSRAGMTHVADVRWRSGEEVGVELRTDDVICVWQREHSVDRQSCQRAASASD
jgi:hypothetical protein